ncbi:MAG: acyltransferase [Ramlibacter sp.]
MDPLHPVFAALCVAAAMAAVALRERLRGGPSEFPSRITIASLQGLRGYLAFFLFIYHAAIWYFYLRTGNWAAPPSRFYTHLGQSSVVLVFMVTGFLFFSRVLDRSREIDWRRLYVSRALRLAPLYVLMVAMLFVAVIALSGWTLKTAPGELATGLAKWLAFAIPGAPDLNGVGNTWIIVAGVAWVLPYEIAFYACLPWLALATGRRVPWPVLLAVLLPLGWSALFPVMPVVFVALAAGMAAAPLARSERVRAAATGGLAAVAALALVVLVAARFPSAYSAAPIAILGIAFAVVACGNDMFGILSGRLARSLGDLSYGIYLLHGIALFALFHWGFGLPVAGNLTPVQFWLAVAGLSPAVVAAAYLVFELLERPVMVRGRSAMERRHRQDL